MKLIEQYIYAVGKYLTYDTRTEIKKELRSLILDDIESRYGDKPTEDEIKLTLSSYGSPKTVAKKYNPSHYAIAPCFTDLYYFIAKLMLLGFSIAFFTIYIISIIEQDLSLSSITYGFITFGGNIVRVMLPGFGVLTLVFIITTRLYKDDLINLDENWTPDDLKEIPISYKKTESIFESILLIVFTFFALVIVNITPWLITLAENSFERSGMRLGHYLNLDLFRYYLIFVSLLWIGDIIYHSLRLYFGSITRKLAIYETVKDGLNVMLFISLVTNMELYKNYTNLIGFRGIFAVIGFFTMIDFIAKLFKLVSFISES